MTDGEVQTYLAQQRTMIRVTNGPSGHPHTVAMWYGLVDGAIWFETKAKSQKAVNLRRDPRITCLIEDGHTYDTLRGASFECVPEIDQDGLPHHRREERAIEPDNSATASARSLRRMKEELTVDAGQVCHWKSSGVRPRRSLRSRAVHPCWMGRAIGLLCSTLAAAVPN